MSNLQRAVLVIGVAALVLSIVVVPTYCETREGEYLGFTGYKAVSSIIETNANSRWSLRIQYQLLFGQLFTICAATAGLVLASSKRKS